MDRGALLGDMTIEKMAPHICIISILESQITNHLHVHLMTLNYTEYHQVKCIPYLCYNI